MTEADITPCEAGAISDDDLRGQVCALVKALGEHTRTMAPLVTVAPALVEMATAYTASKGVVTWIGRVGVRAARWLGILATWALRVGGAAAMMWALMHSRWDIFLQSPKP